VGISKFRSAIKELVDRIEDLELGYTAKEREKSSAKSDYIPIEEIKLRTRRVDR
jgi:hypothetical protein